MSPIHAYRSTRDPCLFFLYSRRIDEAAFDMHAAPPHTLQFLQRVEPFNRPFPVRDTSDTAGLGAAPPLGIGTRWEFGLSEASRRRETPLHGVRADSRLYGRCVHHPRAAMPPSWAIVGTSRPSALHALKSLGRPRPHGARLFYRDGKLGPLLHLDACYQLVTMVFWLENRRFAFLDVEPVFAECVDDVGLVGDENVVLTGSRWSGQAIA